jgi:predicted aminopeptidase
MKLIPLVILLLLSGCADLGYYLYSAQGQLSIMRQTRDIDDILADETTPPRLRQQLQRVQQIRRFAFNQLALPQSGSYTEYADLGRPYVLKNLFATEEFSTQLQRWCYPLVGCAGYRGYFDEARLRRFKAELLRAGKDVYVGHVSAYSTLGWFDDPVLNTFVNWPDYRLAGLIFHELAHQRLYIDDDTRFNESFATALQQAGVEQWLAQQGDSRRLQRYRQYLRNQAQVIDLIELAREQLAQLYTIDLEPAEKRRRKRQRLQALREDYQQLASSFDIKDGFGRWFKGELNNARLASVSTYHAQVAVFRQLLDCRPGDFDLFYRRLEKMGEMPKGKRMKALASNSDCTSLE